MGTDPKLVSVQITDEGYQTERHDAVVTRTGIAPARQQVTRQIHCHVENRSEKSIKWLVVDILLEGKISVEAYQGYGDRELVSKKRTISIPTGVYKQNTFDDRYSFPVANTKAYPRVRLYQYGGEFEDGEKFQKLCHKELSFDANNESAKGIGAASFAANHRFVFAGLHIGVIAAVVVVAGIIIKIVTSIL